MWLKNRFEETTERILDFGWLSYVSQGNQEYYCINLNPLNLYKRKKEKGNLLHHPQESRVISLYIYDILYLTGIYTMSKLMNNAN